MEKEVVGCITGDDGALIKQVGEVLVQYSDGSIGFVEARLIYDEPTKEQEHHKDEPMVNLFSSDNDFDKENTEKTWTGDTTLLLIQMVKKHDKELDTGVKKFIWKKISVEMTEHLKKNITPTQVDTKWKGLVKHYKEIFTHNNTSGKSPKHWEFYDLIHEILFKKPEISPVAIVSSSKGLMTKCISGKLVPETNPEKVISQAKILGSTNETSFGKKRTRKEEAVQKRHSEKMQRFHKLQGSIDKLVDLYGKVQMEKIKKKIVD